MWPPRASTASVMAAAGPPPSCMQLMALTQLPCQRSLHSQGVICSMLMHHVQENHVLTAGDSGLQKALPVLRVYSEALLMSISRMQAENRNVANGDQRGPACPATTVSRPSC